MIQTTIIHQIKNFIHQIKGIDAAFLTGSFAAGSETVASDINLHLIYESDFSTNHLIEVFSTCFKENFKHVNFLKERQQLVFYLFSEMIRTEVTWTHLSDPVIPLFSASGIKKYGTVKQSILFDKNRRLHKYLKNHFSMHSDDTDHQKDTNRINSMIQEFLYLYEKCSQKHQRVDEHQYFSFFHQSLDIIAQLKFISMKKNTDQHIPKHLTERYLDKRMRAEFSSVRIGHSFDKAHLGKRKLLNLFYDIVEHLYPVFPTCNELKPISEIKRFCETIYHRDIVLNFRDIARLNVGIRPGMIYRSVSLAKYQDFDGLMNWLFSHNIHQIIDLRSADEIKDSPYHPPMRSKIDYKWLPIDPKTQMKLNHPAYSTLKADEAHYVFYANECKEQMSLALKYILDKLPNGTLFHCHAGKDRTGSLAALIGLMANIPRFHIESDYLSSGGNMQIRRLNRFLEFINNQGGISDYLLTNIISRSQQELFIKKITA